MTGQIGGATGATGTRRRRRVLPWVLVGLLVLALVELAVIIVVGRSVGVLWTLVGLVALSALGAWLLRREGSRTWRALRTAARTGEAPSRHLADGILVLLGGALLLLPGFVSDVLGLVLILPVTRPLARPVLEQAIRRRAFGDLGVVRVSTGGRRGPRPSDEVVEGEIIE